MSLLEERTPMAKSPTLKKLDNPAVQKRISDWAKKELAELRNSPNPICLQLTNGDFLVGTQKVHKVNDTCWTVDNFEFRDKRCAIFYCALAHRSKFLEANSIRKLDTLVGKLEEDKLFFRYKLDKAHLLNDQFRIDLFGSRYDDSKKKLVQSKEQLEKIITQAKYLQVLGT